MMMSNGITPSLPGPASQKTRLPLLVDICLNVSQILVLLVAIITAILSILSNAGPLTVILRTAVAILSVGIPLYILNFLLGRYYVKATFDELKKNLPEEQPQPDMDDTEHGELEAEA